MIDIRNGDVHIMNELTCIYAKFKDQDHLTLDEIKSLGKGSNSSFGMMRYEINNYTILFLK